MLLTPCRKFCDRGLNFTRATLARQVSFYQSSLIGQLQATAPPNLLLIREGGGADEEVGDFPGFGRRVVVRRY